MGRAFRVEGTACGGSQAEEVYRTRSQGWSEVVEGKGGGAEMGEVSRGGG